MDTSSIIAIAAMVLAAILAILLIKQKASKKRIENKKEIDALAQENGCTISDFDYWAGINSRTKIGVDNSNLKLFFSRTINNNNPSTKVVDISALSKATKYCSYRMMGEDKNRTSVVDVIGITLSYSDKKQPEELLEFFNGKFDNLMVTDEIQSSEKWEAIISDLITASASTKVNA
jgi:hypothetical protein